MISAHSNADQKVATLSFTERMTGWFQLGATDFESGRKAGKAADSPITFILTIVVDDVDATLADTSLPQAISGHLEAPALSPDNLTVIGGTFQLMVPNPDEVQTLNMRYKMDVEATDGRRFHFDGFKVLDHGPIWKTWKATTTLHVTVSEGVGPGGPVVGRGIMIIRPTDFAKQVSTFRVTGVKGIVRRLGVMARFGRGFAGRLVPLYAGELAVNRRFAPDAPHALRPTRLPEPTYRWCGADSVWHDGADVGPDAWLLLTRYQGGTKGPLMLAPGFGMEAASMAAPTIDTTIAEFAYEHGYDVWLFDYRASIRLPTSTSSFTMDDLASTDWPEAIAEVKRVSGAPSVQVLGHCVGSLTILMAVLAGAPDVRSIVCSQFTVHPVTSRLNRTKNLFRVGDIMRKLRVQAIKPGVSPKLRNKALDALLVVLPMPKGERCGSPTCRWLNSIYGLTHNHAQLNDATHDSFDTAFGYANVKGLRHLAVINRKGQAVDYRGNDVYLPNVARVTMPILFVQGARNHIFRPAGTAKTVAWLSEHHDPKLFETFSLPDYAHLDMIVGKNAAVEVFPAIVEHLDRFN